MADISQVQVGSTTYDVHDAIARTDVSNEIARAKKAESDEYTRATTAEAALRDSMSNLLRMKEYSFVLEGSLDWQYPLSITSLAADFGVSED